MRAQEGGDSRYSGGMGSMGQLYWAAWFAGPWMRRRIPVALKKDEFWVTIWYLKIYLIHSMFIYNII